jgi:predicted ATPase
VSFLKKVTFNWGIIENKDVYPFNIPSLSKIKGLDLNNNVTFFIGENGTGKSTILESIAFKCGFGNKGGGKYNISNEPDASQRLEEIITLSWMPKVSNGFFLRAETFFDFANYIDELATEGEEEKVYKYYGGKSLHQQSHGEAFISLFTNRFSGKGLYILDEPEAALSPQRQFAFLRIIRDLEQTGEAQFIIATHSPILMAYPGAKIYSFDVNQVRTLSYEETEHYQLTKVFLNDHRRFLTQLFED